MTRRRRRSRHRSPRLGGARARRRRRAARRGRHRRASHASRAAARRRRRPDGLRGRPVRRDEPAAAAVGRAPPLGREPRAHHRVGAARRARRRRRHPGRLPQPRGRRHLARRRAAPGHFARRRPHRAHRASRRCERAGRRRQPRRASTRCSASRRRATSSTLTWDPYRRVPSRDRRPASTALDLWTPHRPHPARAGRALPARPSVVVAGRDDDVFTRTQVRRPHRVRERRQAAGAPGTATTSRVDGGGPAARARTPSALYDPATSEVRVAATELAPHRGDVVVFSPDDVGGRVWSVDRRDPATTHSRAPRGVAAVIYGGRPDALRRGPDRGPHRVRRATDGTTRDHLDVDGPHRRRRPVPPQIAGTPSATVSGTRLAIAGGGGERGATCSSGPTPRRAARSPRRTSRARGRADADRRGHAGRGLRDGQLTLFAAGVAVPAPEGTGVYSIPYAKWAQALRGRVAHPRRHRRARRRSARRGRSCPRRRPDVQADEYVGDVDPGEPPARDLAQLLDRERPGHDAWLGVHRGEGADHRAHLLPARLPRGPVRRDPDRRLPRAAGSGSSPTGCSSTPRATPTTTRACGARRTPAQAREVRRQLVRDPERAGARASPRSTRRSRPALYANQYEYMTYKLYDQPLPDVRRRRVLQGVSGKKLVAPARFAFGPNICRLHHVQHVPPDLHPGDERAAAAHRAAVERRLQHGPDPARQYCPPGPG